MPDRHPRFRSISSVVLGLSLPLLATFLISSCGDSSGPTVAVTLVLDTVDGLSMPAAVKGTDGRTFTIGTGRLQGTDLGPSCGMSLQLATGPIASVEVPQCKLTAGNAFKFKATLTDSRFPSGPHEYRFVAPP